MIRKQDNNYIGPQGRRDTLAGAEWLDMYDALHGYWLPTAAKGRYGHTAQKHTTEDSHVRLIQAIWRSMQRRHYPTLPVRDHFKSTVDYYNAIMPLLMAQRHIEQTSSSWRYVRPMMVRMMFLRWPHPKFH